MAGLWDEAGLAHLRTNGWFRRFAGAILDAAGNGRGPLWLAMILFSIVVPLGIAFQFFKDVRLTDYERKV